MEGQESRQRTLRDVLCVSHPTTYKCIEGIKQHKEIFLEAE